MKKKILRIHMFIRANKIILFLSDQYHRPIITYFPQFFYPFILKKQYTIYQNIYIYIFYVLIVLIVFKSISAS